MRIAYRLATAGKGKYGGLTQKVNGNPVWTGVLRVDEKALRLPLHWQEGRCIFVNSMSDLFHESLDRGVQDAVFAVMGVTPRHQYQILTKRADVMRAYMSDPARDSGAAKRSAALAARLIAQKRWPEFFAVDVEGNDFTWTWRTWPLPNVWLGVSVENQGAAEERMSILAATPAAVRFVSVEPLIGAVDLRNIRWATGFGESNVMFDALAPRFFHSTDKKPITSMRPLASPDLIIVGGESGPRSKRRKMDLAWARSLRDQCKQAGVPFFMKQIDKKTPIPDDLMIREWPAGRQRPEPKEEKAA